MARVGLYALGEIDGGGIHTTIDIIKTLAENIWAAYLPYPFLSFPWSFGPGATHA